MPNLKRKKTASRTTVNESLSFSHGSIVSIAVKDFMTYTEVKLTAGPYLNMVLGPNGTGKSAIVCGLIIGLGGDASTTGRSASLKEYIRFGCSTASILIEIANSKGNNYTIRREISIVKNRNKEECHSKWELNNHSSSLTEVRQFVWDLNIRVDNLCQFLPQERVVEFAKMDEKQLLLNTEKAAGNKEMFDNHQKLIERSKIVKELEEKRSALAKDVDMQTHLNEQLAGEVERVKQKEEHVRKIECLQKKKLWLEFENVRQEYCNLKFETSSKDKELKKCRAKHAPLRKRAEIAARKVDICKGNYSKAQNAFREHSARLKSKSQMLAKLSEKTHSILSAFESKVENEKKRKQDVKNANEEIRGLNMKLNALKDTEDLIPDIENISRNIEELLSTRQRQRDEKDKVTSKKEAVELKCGEAQQSLKSVQNVFHQRMEILKRINKNAFEAASWLGFNKNKFTGDVFPPILTQINIKDQRFAKFVEKVIPTRDLLSFVFEDVEDLKKFNQLLYEEKRIRVNVVMKPQRAVNEFVPDIPMSQLRQFGFSCYINETFTAPPAVMAYLCSLFRIHEIPFGIQVNAKEVIERNMRINRFFSGDNYYVVTESKYDREKVTSTESVTNAQKLVVSFDEKKCREDREKFDKCKKEIEELNAMLSEIDKSMNETDEKIRSSQSRKQLLTSKVNERKTIATKIALREEQVRRLMREDFDLEAERRKVTAKLLEIFKEKSTIVSQITEETVTCVEMFKRKVRETGELRLSVFLKKDCEELVESADSQFKNLEQEVIRFKERLDVVKKEAKSKRSVACKAINVADNADIPEDWKQKFAEFPDDLEEVASTIRNLHLRIESMSINYDSNVLRDFDNRNKLIGKKREELAGLMADIQLQKSEMMIIKEAWLPRLKNLLDCINTSFGRFMERLNYAGEVSLSTGNDVDDFEKYGISIKVKFRDNECLKPLSPIHQSGGERSVTTMIYMIALQELTTSPFRCVDEINQGMDNTNERKVFELVVETASKNSSQYFLFSPKLLSGLAYSEKMHVHIIFNGPNLNVKRWNSEE